MIASYGTIELKANKQIPDKILRLIEEDNELKFRKLDNLCYYAEFGEGWRLAHLINCVTLLNTYLESGAIMYYNDYGENGRAIFNNNTWNQEWEETYYFTDLPDNYLTRTPRVAEILNIIANDLMACSDSERAVEVLLNKCKLTDEEIKLYNLSWLNDLRIKEKE